MKLIWGLGVVGLVLLTVGCSSLKVGYVTPISEIANANTIQGVQLELGINDHWRIEYESIAKEEKIFLRHARKLLGNDDHQLNLITATGFDLGQDRSLYKVGLGVSSNLTKTVESEVELLYENSPSGDNSTTRLRVDLSKEITTGTEFGVRYEVLDSGDRGEKITDHLVLFFEKRF